MKKVFKITNEQFKYIVGKDLHNFEDKILQNCFCGNCGGDSKILDFQIELNDLSDAVFRGKCKKCKLPMSRYVEIGDIFKYTGRIEEIKKIIG